MRDEMDRSDGVRRISVLAPHAPHRPLQLLSRAQFCAEEHIYPATVLNPTRHKNMKVISTTLIPANLLASIEERSSADADGPRDAPQYRT